MRIISGQFRNRTLVVPKGNVTRPTSGQLREAVFNILQHYIEDAYFLDLFAGSGAMGLEALSRHAAYSVFIDADREAVKAIKTNIKNLDVEKQSEVLAGNVLNFLPRLAARARKFDIIYADPPYSLTMGSQQVYMAQAILNLIDKEQLLAESGILFLEDAKSTQINVEHLTSLTFVKSRHMGRSTIHQFERKES